MSDNLKATWAACLKDIRMVVDSTPSDEELEEKIGQVAQELLAIEKALNDDGNYLGIVNKQMLKTRKDMLEKRSDLLKQERQLLQGLRATLEEEKERSKASRAGKGGIPPRLDRVSEQGGMKTAAGNGRTWSPSVRPALPKSRPFGGAAPLDLSPPSAASSGIGEFLKANAGVGSVGRGPKPKRVRFPDGMRNVRGELDEDHDVIMA